MSLFLPDASVTEMVFKASPAFASEMVARQQKSGAADYHIEDHAPEVLGSQVIGRIAMLSRHVAVEEPGEVIRLAEADLGHFDARFRKSLLGYLRISSQHPHLGKILVGLSQGLYEWIESDSSAALALGLAARHEDAGRFILLTCMRQEPVLSPL